MPRNKITDAQWELVEPLLPGRRNGKAGRPSAANRTHLEGILWIARTGSPWRDLPEAFGKWITVYQRFRRWSLAGVFERVFEATTGLLDLRSVQVDGTFVKVHQHGTGAPRRGGTPETARKREAIGRTRGGLNTKLMALVDHDGQLVRFSIAPGNAAEVREVEPLINGVPAAELVADKAYDSDALRHALAEHGITATIPPRVNRVLPRPFDAESYRRRHLVENYFADLKQFRGVATRYCKLAERFSSMVTLAAWFIATR